MSKKRSKKPQLKLRSAAEPSISTPLDADAPEPAPTPAPWPPSTLHVPDNLWRKALYWFLAAAFVTLPFGLVPGTLNPYNKAYFVVIFVAVLSFIAMTVAVCRKSLPLLYSPFLAAVGLWLLAKLITTATSMAPAKSFWGSYNSWSDGFIYGLAVAVILYVALALYLDHKKIARLLDLMIAQAAVLSIMTLWQAYKAGFFYQKVRPDSPLLNADFFISYGLLLVPLIAILFVGHVWRRKWLAAGLYGLSGLLLASALFVSLPTHLQTLILPPLLNGKKDTTYGATDQKAIGAGNFTQTNANLERWTEWKIGVTLGQQRPLVGTGPSTTGQAFIANKNQLDLAGWDNSHVMTRSHNDIIEQFSEEGILGLATYILLWGTFGWILFKNWRRIEVADRPYAWGLLGGLVLWFGFNILLFTTVVAGLVAWVWIALLLTLVKSPRKVETPRGRAAGCAIMITLAVVLTAVGIWTLRYYKADAAIAHAMSINAGLNEGRYNNLPSDQRVNARLAAEAETHAAADDIIFEDYYASQASLSSINAYFGVEFKDPAEAKRPTDDALRYAQQAVKGDEYSPENLQTLGGIQYYLAPAGSAAERKGIALIDHAIALTPKSVAWYIKAAQIAVLKKDYPLADSYIQRGLAATPKASDHQQLENLKASLAHPK